jgi:hypothetical protein
MGNALHKLSARRVATETKVGRHSDGGGLYLVVAPTGPGSGSSSTSETASSARWDSALLLELGARSLADARTRAAECRAVLARGEDPIEFRKERAQAPVRQIPSFGDFADRYIVAHRSSWRNEKHVAQWQMTLTTYAEPIRAKPVDEVTREDVLAILRPIWATKNETASRLRGRIEAV